MHMNLRVTLSITLRMLSPPVCLRHALLPAAFVAHAACAAMPLAADWPMYNKAYDGQRYANLDQINAGNVAGLAEVCRIKLAKGGSFHSGPLVIDGVLYVTTARLTLAIDARDCALRWRAVYAPEQEEVWGANRGAAYAGGRLFRGTADGRLLALDAKSGKLLWKVAPADPKRGEFLSSAPIVSDGLLYIGVAGGDWGIRGRMMAFDIADGREVWRFNTIPLPHESGAETWERPETLATGGGGTWGSYALDVARGEVFVPVANPAPDFAPAYRPGANLYTNSLLVLDTRTGKRIWHYQIAPNDSHDYGLGAAPMLYRQRGGREAVALAAKDGHLYVLDRASRALLFKTAVTTIENAGLPPTPEGRRFCPGAYGGTEWNGPALDPARNAIVVGAVDWCSIIKTETPSHEPGRLFMGGSYTQLPPALGRITSLDADSGRINWQYRAGAPVVAAITPTAGGIVFAGDLGGNFLALDSVSGRLLYRLDTGGAVAGGIVTYAVAGRQYVATTSGNVSRATFGALGAPTVIVLALPDGKPVAPRRLDVSADDAASSWWSRLRTRLAGWRDGWRRPGGAIAPAADARDPLARGKTLFAANCAGCHGRAGEGLAGPALQNLRARRSDAQIVAALKQPKPPMPALYPAMLSERDVRDLADYLHGL